MFNKDFPKRELGGSVTQAQGDVGSDAEGLLQEHYHLAYF